MPIEPCPAGLPGQSRVDPQENCQHCKLASPGPGLVFYFQSPLHSSPDRSTVQTMPYQTTLACPSPQARTQNRLRVSGAPISIPAVLSVQCRLALPKAGRPGHPAPAWGSSFSACFACLPLHNFQWALCNWSCWRCCAGAGPLSLLSALVSPSPVSETASCHNRDGVYKPAQSQDPTATALSAWNGERFL
jgi:hypothetical protein